MDRDEECIPLIKRGWWLAGATLASYQKDLLAPPFPTWEPV
jgi:hypothetical protein